MLQKPLAIAVLAVVLSGCSFADKMLPGSGSSAQIGVAPQVLQRGNGAQWVQFTPKTFGALYSAIALGPDGNIWFLDENAASLVRLGEGGASKEFSLSGVLTGSAVSMARKAARRP